MPKLKQTTLPSTEVKARLGGVLSRVYKNNELVIVERNGLPIAAIISYQAAQQFIRMLDEAQHSVDMPR